MKKIILFSILILSACNLIAQQVRDEVDIISVGNNYYHTENMQENVSVLLLENVVSGIKIQYKSDNWNSFVCDRYGAAPGTLVPGIYSETNVPGSNKKAEIEIDETLIPVGYVLKIDGKEFRVWVAAYKDYLPTTSADFTVIPNEDEPCEKVTLLFQSDEVIPKITYWSPGGNMNVLGRTFELNYDTKVFNEEYWVSEPVAPIQVTFPLNEFVCDAPLADTKFILTGDQFAREMGIELITLESETYNTIRVEGSPTHIASLREALNEDKRPSDEKQIEGSAPLYIKFMSNPSTDGNLYGSLSNWMIYKDKHLLITRTEEEHRYTFNEPGEYIVKLQVKSTHESGCTFTADSIIIKVIESALQVPNVFTPNNGDEINNEFRVAYRSLESFECWVYNNWGNLVYHWSDPAKGWDGKINGKDAPVGPYFYIIKARGTDGVNHNKKGDINIIR